MDKKTSSFPLTSIQESMNMPLGKTLADTYKKIFTWDWVFTTWYEKIIVISAILWGIYSIGKLFF